MTEQDERIAREQMVITVSDSGFGNSGARWQPKVGSVTYRLLESAVPEPVREEIRDSASSILSKGVPPTAAVGQETGLVVGYVQSGKTLSFTTVAALARDNHFQLAIIITGTATNLLEQSTKRLRKDLQIDDGDDRKWVLFKNPKNETATRTAIQNIIEDWRDPAVPDDDRKTMLVTVMKHHGHLKHLRSLLSSFDLVGVPALVIDDEADQASLNTEASAGQGELSTTYRRILELRNTLPQHTFLQYTATPQAPLLVNIIDSLSPNFVNVLEPGSSYVGGWDFFHRNPELVRVIPPEDVPTRDNPVNEPPASLIDALRVFMIGVAAGLRLNGERGNRSMLVHPSHRTAQHEEFFTWVNEIFENWRGILRGPDGDPEKQELFEDFRAAYDDLRFTAEDIPEFDELAQHLPRAFRRTRLIEVNTRGRPSTPDIDWSQAYAWILVGGMAMDRGFTVEGLTVTYMPRGVGVGNADTVQQRARFFGYKREYLGYCRVYLEEGTLNAYEQYAEHEEDIRTQLKDVQKRGASLNDWKRTFILSSALRPCRKSVLEFDYIRGKFKARWFTPAVVMSSEAAYENNRAVVDQFSDGLEFLDDGGHAARTATQRHHVCYDVPLQTVLQDLLVDLRLTGRTDSQLYTGILLQLKKALEDNPDEVCAIYKMSPAATRERGVYESGEITNLFQGEAPVTPKSERGTVYPGDREVRQEENVTVQIHRISLKSTPKESGATTLAEDVPVVAIWIPRRLSKQWISQRQDTADNDQ